MREYTNRWPLEFIGHAFGFADRVIGHDERQDFFGDLQLRRRLFGRFLPGRDFRGGRAAPGCGRLRARSATSGGCLCVEEMRVGGGERERENAGG